MDYSKGFLLDAKNHLKNVILFYLNKITIFMWKNCLLLLLLLI